jgi:hypothetical protein
MTDEGREGRGGRSGWEVGGGRGGIESKKPILRSFLPSCARPSPLLHTMSWHGGRRGNAVLRHIELSFAEGVVDLDDEDGGEEEDTSDAFVSAARPPAFAAHALQWDDGCILKVRRNGGG